MTGGVISGGTADTGSGGNVYLDSNAVASFADCQITAGNAKISGSGVYSEAQSLTLGGNVTIQNNAAQDLYLSSGMLTMQNLGQDARIGIAMKTPGTFAQNVQTDLSGKFFSNDDAYIPAWVDHALMLQAK